MAETGNTMKPEDGNHVRFYGSFVGALKWSVVAIALLLILLAIFLVR